MDIIQIVGIGLMTTILAVILREQKAQFAFLLVVIVGLFIFMFLLDKIVQIVDMIRRLAQHTELNNIFLETILKIIGIAYIAEFGAQIARDAGEEGIAAKIELAGKVFILVMAIPIIMIIVETVLKLLPI
ncbi:MAG: stage III sporulation protein AD [Bacillaceae bacterium G1]|nr:stage III sporulation protein AD [Bacillota bacterium]OJF17020.1 MAG: stage III sporulation protein AD [Bacillaceae bacterium G1]